MFLRTCLCLLFFAGFANAENLEFRGFRKNELVLITLIHNETISTYPFRREISTEYCFCKILEVTPTHLKVKIYYQANLPTYMSIAEKEELKKTANIRRNTVSSFHRASINIIEGWPSDSMFPKPGPFDLW